MSTNAKIEFNKLPIGVRRKCLRNLKNTPTWRKLNHAENVRHLLAADKLHIGGWFHFSGSPQGLGFWHNVVVKYNIA